jgi:murein DD-endopeptidase MepM/ murein hydrolase activator NlpD
VLILTAGLASLPAHGFQPSSLQVSTTAGEVGQGEMLVLSIACGCAGTSGTASGAIFNAPIPLYGEADAAVWHALVGIDLDTRPGTYTVSVVLNTRDGPPLTTTHRLRVVGRLFPTRRLSVAPAFVDPPAAVHRRILDEAAELQALLKRTTPRASMRAVHPPLATGVTSNFGARSVFNGQARSPHAGVDYAGPVGTPVHAPADATVALAADLYFTGRTVVLDHGQGLYSILAHLSAISVEAGASVERGTTVGALGATGRVTGPHLHWGMRLHGTRIDPLSALRALSD